MLETRVKGGSTKAPRAAFACDVKRRTSSYLNQQMRQVHRNLIRLSSPLPLHFRNAFILVNKLLGGNGA